MSQKQIQLKSPKAQNSKVFNDEEEVLRSNTQKSTFEKDMYPNLENKQPSMNPNAKQPDFGRLSTPLVKEGIVNANDVKFEEPQPKLQDKQKQQFEVQRSIIPLSHAKRQKSLSPIKNQHSIVSQEQFSISGPRLILASMPKVETTFEPSVKSEPKSSIPFILPNTQEICNQPVTHFYRREIYQKAAESARRSHSRRTQIFSSDKKHAEKSLLLPKNSIADQMLNQNKVQRGQPRKFRLQNDAYITKPQKPQIVQNSSPMSKKSRIQSIQTLSNSKEKEIKKLEGIFASPQKASLEYWQSIYPQSKKYLASLTSVLSEEKKVLQKWQFDLQATLRESLFQVEEILLQKTYEICRLTVKRWVEQEIQALQGFCNQNFAYFPGIKDIIQSKQRDLEAVQKALQSFRTIYENNLERSRVYRLIEGTILSSEYTDEISQISVKVKELITKSEEVALKFCSEKLQKAKNLISFQYQHEKYRLDKTTYDLLQAVFSDEDGKKQVRKSSKKLIIPDMNIGDKIQKILDKSEIRNAETARQATFSEFSESKMHVPMSHRKEKAGGLKIRNKEKQFEEFQSEFEMRKKKFVGVSFSVYGEEKIIQQIPVSNKGQEDNEFERKLSSLLKKINDKKAQEIEEQVKMVSTPKNQVHTPKNYNEYQENLRKKKQENRQNFFRYSMQ